MKLIRIMSALMSEPWVILPSQHAVLVDAVKKHLAMGKSEIKAEDDPLMALLAKEDDPLIERRGNIAIVKMCGVMGQHLSSLDMACGGVDVGLVGRAIDEAIADPVIKGIALFVDSPGGVVSGVPELAAKIRDACAVKPIIAYTDSQICSGAIWATAGADEIYATQSALIGSIGAYCAFLDRSKAYEMNGLKMERIRSGKLKGAGMDGMSLSDDERAAFQARTDGIGERFRAWVRECRPGVNEDAMQGQAMYGYDGVEAGLIDGIKTESEVLAHLGSIIAAMDSM
jgi:protease-4